MKLFFFILFFPSLVFAQAVDDKFACSTPDPGWSMTEVSKWAESMDILGQNYLRKSGIVTKFGNPIHSSCYTGLTPDEWKIRLDRIEAGLAYAMTQAQRCWKDLGLAATTGIIPKLRRTRINCSDSNYAAAAAMGANHAPNWDKKYELIDWGKYMDTMPMESIGSTLFHEALHWGVSNNRHYHNNTKSRNRLGCDKSLYEDRVYLTEAACFPESDVGGELYHYNGAVNCPGVCEKSLSEADHGLDKKYDYAGGDGKTLHGYNYKIDEAKAICSRIRDVPKKFKASRQELFNTRERHNIMSDFALKRFGEDENGRHLQSLVEEAFLLVENAYDPNNSISGIKVNFAEKKSRFISALKSSCSRTDNSQNMRAFCTQYTPEKNPLTDEFDRLAIQLNEIKVSDFNLYSKAPSIPQLRLIKKK